jgi:hypothetical protein
MPTCIAKKEIRITLRTGIVEHASPFAGSHSIWNGPTSRLDCWRRTN